jgi:hypothetical protein
MNSWVGEWRIEVPGMPLAPDVADAARVSFEWTLERHTPDFLENALSRIYAKLGVRSRVELVAAMATDQR